MKRHTSPRRSPDSQAVRSDSARNDSNPAVPDPARRPPLASALAWFAPMPPAGVCGDSATTGAASYRCSGSVRDRDRDALGVCLSRRRMIQICAAGTLVSTAASSLAAAKEGSELAAKVEWKKSSKEAAGYIERDHRAAQECGSCHFFIDPDECIIVESPVSPWGFCNFYED